MEAIATSTTPENYENDRFSGFPTVKSKSHSSKMKPKNYAELLRYPFIQVYKKKQRPPVPKFDLFWIFLDFCRRSEFLGPAVAK